MEIEIDGVYSYTNRFNMIKYYTVLGIHEIDNKLIVDMCSIGQTRVSFRIYANELKSSGWKHEPDYKYREELRQELKELVEE